MSATPEEYKFSLAQLYIVGKADVWLRRSKILKSNPTWPAFCKMLIQRFSSHSSYQLVESFNNLKQQNLSVTEYADLFEELMATVTEENPELSEGWFVRCFVNGLRDGIKYQLRPLRPNTLTEAFWLAKDMEQNHPPKRTFNAYVPPYQRFNTLPAPPVVKALPAPPVAPKLDYPPAQPPQPRARKPGDCWRCGDKWFHGHKCSKIPALHTMQAESSDQMHEEEEVTAEQQQQAEEHFHNSGQLMSISGQAIDSTTPPTTPCVLITIGGKRTVALLDSGSTSTFIDQAFAIKANCHLCSATPQEVHVAGGGTLSSNSIVPDFSFTIGKHQFTHQFSALTLPGHDVVLGCDWMSQYSPVAFHFKEQEFHMQAPDGSAIILPTCSPSDTAVDIEAAKLCKLLDKGASGFIIQLHSLKLSATENQELNDDIAFLL
jgi:hypothetical protein